MYLEFGDPLSVAAPLVRLHSACLTGEALGSLRCDCGEQLETALAVIAREGCGALVYLMQEGRGIGLLNKIRAYALQDRGYDTIDANLALGFPTDLRNYAVAAEILADRRVRKVRLLTNNPEKPASLAAHGVAVTACVPMQVTVQAENRAYVRTKIERLGHVYPMAR